MFDAIDVGRVRRRLEELREIGRTDEDGVTRLAYSHGESEAIEYVLGELPEGYEPWEDALGNCFASREPDAERSLYLGSHLDTVYNGGWLDGALGVVAAMEAIEAAHAADADLQDPPTLTVFRAEESARFGQHTVGSRGALGLLDAEALSSTDDNGVPLWHAMREAGFEPADLSEPTIDTERVAGFLELHIEQGRVLDESETDDIGLVTDVRAPSRFRVTVRGSDDHSGATPMGLRRDALAGAGEMIAAVESVTTDADADGDVVATVGDLTAVDGAINQVCGEATFPVDLRSTDGAFRDEVESRLRETIHGIGARRDLDVVIDRIDRSEPESMSRRMLDRLEDGAKRAEAAYRLMPSGGGHDAMNFVTVGLPAGMVFVPSVDGVSHNPAEETEMDAVAAAIRTMTATLLDGEH